MGVIVLDLDGTLLRADKSLSSASRDAMLRAKAAGHELVFATARPPRLTLSLLPAELAGEFVVCYNGAQVLRHGHVLRQQAIPAADVAGVFSYLERAAPGIARGFEHEDQLYAIGSFEHHFPRTSYAPMPAALRSGRASPKILVDVAQGLALTGLLRALPPTCHAILTDGGTLCQIMPAGADKATGVAFVLEAVGAGFDEVVAFGDDHNDLPLFRRAGCAVAMGNAVPELKTLAHAITDTNEEDGVARFLDGWLCRRCHPGGG
jgi:hydroxymethylpyrimidine pyrophosphatase-like HAD family hydrolase